MPSISVLQSLSPPSHSPGFISSSSSSSSNNTLNNSQQQPQPTRRSAAHSSSPSSPTSSNNVDEEIRKIKDAAKESVSREAKDASPISVLNSAKRQLEHATDFQSNGDYPKALRFLYITAGLVSLCFDSPEYKSGVIKRETTEFMSKEGKDLFNKIKEVEAQLKTILMSSSKQSLSNGVVRQSGGSIQDRLRSLEGAAGTTLKTTKPLVKDPPKLPNGKLSTTPKPSPRPAEEPLSPSPRPIIPNIGLSLSSSSSPSHSIHTVPPTPASAVPPSPHTFVPTSSFGPPSPTSSPASSPRMSLQPIHPTPAPPPPPPPEPSIPDEVAEFNSQFPTIEQLDAELSIMPTGESSGSGRMHTGGSSASVKFNQTYPPLSAIPTGSSTHSNTKQTSGSSSPSFRPFVIPVDRPSSTPIVPISSGFNSRPPSPSPGIISPSTSWQPPKPSGLSGIPTVPEEVHEPNLIQPEDVAALIAKTQALLLDVRNRTEYLTEQIDAKANAMICIEPSVLSRPDISCSRIEDALALSSPNEASLFKFRNKVDHIVLYDQSSTSFGPPFSPLNVLARTLSENKTKHPPLLMVGGLDAWKKQGRELKVASLPPNITTRPHSSSLPISPPLSYKLPNGSHKVQPSIDYPTHTRAPAESTAPVSPPLVNDITPQAPLNRRPAMSRSAASSISISSSSSPRTTPITYPQVSTRMSSASGSIPTPPITSPPIASALSRRRSDYIDQSQEALTSARHAPGHSVDYPNLPSMSMSVLRPPPPAATPVLERQDNRPPRIPPKPTTLAAPLTQPAPPRINSQVPVVYWGDQEIATTGLRNMGNTCYMNSIIQCLCATTPFARFFMDPAWTMAINHTNKLGSQGMLAYAFAKLVRELWKQDNAYIVPKEFRSSICQQNSQYVGSDQHDSQEFLSFLLDGIHEDLNRIIGRPDLTKTAEQEAELERMPPQMAAEQEWQLWRMRNDSIIVDWFQGQFRNQLKCLTCGQTSTTYNAFSLLSLPIPNIKSKKVPLDKCFEAYCNTETLDKDDAWHCTKCKAKRKTTKELSLSRLPPVLIVHLKRFENHGRFSDKVDTFVDFPLKGLDLDRFMPAPLPAGAVKDASAQMSPSDPRRQVPPYRYDLYAVTNHYGNLSSGHYTAFVASGKDWLYCDDSSIKKTDAKDVVNQKAYVLFYKRVKV